jgi:ubiquinone/menaquinone biosynthesis C-methylase UbiE
MHSIGSPRAKHRAIEVESCNKELAMTLKTKSALFVMLAALGGTISLQAQGQTSESTGAPASDHQERRFDSSSAKKFDDPARDAWQMPERVIETLALQPGQIVADIGAGTGYFTIRLARSPQKPTVYALDIEPSMIDYITNRASAEGLKNVTAVLTPEERAKLPEPVDLVLIVNTYHHLGKRVAYFRDVRQSMKKGARLAIVDYRPGMDKNIPTEFQFTPEQIAAELSQAGFRLVAQPDFLPRQQFLIFEIGDTPR